MKKEKFLVFLSLGLILISTAQFAFSVSVDNGADLEEYASIAIGTDGNPVVSYYDQVSGGLLVIHCNNVSCSLFDTTTVDSFGVETSIKIGSDGNPVISYRGSTGGLYFIHCTNISCSSHDNPQILETDLVDYTSLAVGGGNPVISYFDYTHNDLRLIRCAALSCSNHYSPQILDSGGVGLYLSVANGSDGYPVVSYYDYTNHHLKVIHCTNSICSTHDAPQRADNSDWNGYYTAIAIASDGFPIISYYDNGFDLVHCTSLSCSSHDTPQLLDSPGYGVDGQTSVMIGSDNNPMTSYYDLVNHQLKLIHCANTTCSSHDAPVIVDNGGFFRNVPTSIAKGSDGYPVVIYFDYTNGNLKLIHCTSVSCSSHGTPVFLTIESVDVGKHTSIAINSYGWPMIGHYDTTHGKFKILNCTSPLCSTLFNDYVYDNYIDAGDSSSISIGSDDFPVIGYHDITNAGLKLIHCTYKNCIGYDSPILLDTGNVGYDISLAIGTDSYPVISYRDGSNGHLKLVHCTKIDCSSHDAPRILDSSDTDTGYQTSIVIGSDGNPIISYHASFDPNLDAELKVYHCGNVSCSSGIARTLDSSTVRVGGYSSIAKGSDGNPVISYYDQTNGDLKLAHCTSVDCAANNEVVIDSDGDVGAYSSIAIGTNGYPVISYYDNTNGDLKVAHCTNVSCSTHFQVTLDSAGNVGKYTSIAIGVDGIPAISYYDATFDNLNFIQDTTECIIPASGDWIITSSCTIGKSAAAPGNVIVNSHALLTVPNGITFSIPFTTNHLLIHQGGGVLVMSGGKLN